MSSTPTSYNRLEKQGEGDNLNTWGVEHLNPTLDLADALFDGQLAIDTDASPANPFVLTVSNFSPDQARSRIIRLTGSAAPPAIELPFGLAHWYWVKNDTAYPVTFSFAGGGGNSVAIPPGIWMLLVEGGTELVTAQPGLDPETVSPVSASNYAVLSTDVQKVKFLLGACNVTLDATFLATLPGSWVVLRTAYGVATFAYTDPWLGAQSLSIPYSQFVKVVNIGDGASATVTEWSPQVVFGG